MDRDSDPQFAYVTHAAWERIVDKLVVGQPAYLYSNICPHDDPDLCQCPKRTCFIEDNKLYGTRDGVTLRLVVVPWLWLSDAPNAAAHPPRQVPKSREGKKGRGRR